MKMPDHVIKTIVGAAIASTIIGTGTGIALADSRYDESTYKREGFISLTEESANAGPGIIQTTKGDCGGRSYGLCQFAAKTGTTDEFVKWLEDNHPEFYIFFKDAGKAGTEKFDKAWLKACDYDIEKFGDTQLEYTNKKMIEPANEKIKKETGLDFNDKEDPYYSIKKEILISKATHLGVNGFPNLIIGIQDKLSNDMPIEDFINTIYDEISKIPKKPKESQRIYELKLVRCERERNKYLDMAKELQTPTIDEILKAPIEETKVETTSSNLVETAESYLDKDVEYDFGNKDIESGGLDCSGYVTYVMNDMGLNDINKYYKGAYSYHADSKKISEDELQPGDLVFWETTSSSAHSPICHIAIYVGDGNIIDCSYSENGIKKRSLEKAKSQLGSQTKLVYGRYAPLTEKIEQTTEMTDEVYYEFASKLIVNDEEEKIETNYLFTESDEEEAPIYNAKKSGTENVSNKLIVEDEEKLTVDESTGEEKLVSEIDTEIEKNTEKETIDIDTETVKEESNETVENEEVKDETITEEKVEEKKETKSTIFIGDSRFDSIQENLKDSLDNEVLMFSKVGISPYAVMNDTECFGEALIKELPENSDDIDEIVIGLGINNITSANNYKDMTSLIDYLKAKYPGKKIKVLKTLPVGSEYNYKDLDLNADDINSKVEELNNKLSEYCESTDNSDVDFKDASNNLVDDNGYLKEPTNDNLHLSEEKQEKYVENIKEIVNEKENNENNNEITAEEDIEKNTENKEVTVDTEQTETIEKESEVTEEKEKTELDILNEKLNNNMFGKLFSKGGK